MEYIENDPNIPTSQHPVLTALNEKVTSLELNVTSLRTQLSDLKYKNATTAEAVKTIIIDAMANEEMSEDVAKKLAELFDIELTKTITVTGSISFSGTAEVSIFEDINDHDLRFNVDINSLDVSAYGADLYNLDYDLEESDWSEY